MSPSSDIPRGKKAAKTKDPRLARIGEAAREFQLKTSTLRFWEDSFPQLQPVRTETGQRLYTEENMRLLRRIHYLLHERGMTIEGARRILDGESLPTARRMSAGRNAPSTSKKGMDAEFSDKLEERDAVIAPGEAAYSAPRGEAVWRSGTGASVPASHAPGVSLSAPASSGWRDLLVSTMEELRQLRVLLGSSPVSAAPPLLTGRGSSPGPLFSPVSDSGPVSPARVSPLASPFSERRS